MNTSVDGLGRMRTVHLEGLLNAGELAKAKKLFNNILNEKTATTHQLNVLLKQCSIKEAKTVITHASNSGVLPDTATFNTLLGVCKRLGTMEDVRSVVHEMRATGLEADSYTER